MNHRQRGFDLVYDIREEREFLLEELRLFLFLVVFVLALLPGDGPLVVDLERCDEHACEQQEIEPDGGRALVETLLHHDRQRFVADGLCGSRRQAADFERIGSGRHVVIEYRVVGDRAAPLRVVAHEPALYGVELRQRRVEDGESESERILPRGEVDGPGAVHVADEGRTPVVGGDDQFVADAEFGDDQPGVSAFAVEFLGVEADALHASAAKELGLVDEIVSYEECIAMSDMIVVAVPVSIAIRMIPDILDKVDRQVVTDVCSTKEKINDMVRYHPNRKNFVAAHPMAGTEYSGPWAALPGLFDGRAGIICNAEDSDMQAVELVKQMYDCLNMRVIYMRAAHHDMHTAYISHISHITSFALALTVLEKEKNEKNIFDLASGGFSSTVRLAKSNADMWAPIFSQNKENILTVLDTYIEKLQEFKKHIADYDEKGVKDLIHKANKIKRIIR